MLEAAATIYAQMVDGKTDSDIIDMLRIDAATYKELKNFMFETHSEELRTKPREHVYIEYVAEQRRNIQDLNRLVKDLDTKSQYNAIVGAIRLRSDIVDKIVEKGQEFGLIKKEAQRHEVIGGIAVVNLSVEDLRKGILEQTKLLKDVTERFGEGDIKGLPEGVVHYAGAPVKRPVSITTTAELVPEDDSWLDAPVPKAAPKKSKKRASAARASARE